MYPVELSVIIPVYNEAAVIGETLQDVATYLAAAAESFEVVVVDDGSTDQTAAVVRDLQPAMAELRVIAAAHQGKGAAVRRGMLAARGRYRLFMDADHATRIEEWARCRIWLAQGYAMTIGSRKMPGAVLTVRQPPLREAMGEVVTWLTNALLGTRVSDVTCGFKCFKAEAAGGVFERQRINGWGFDAEILFLARRLGYRVKEVPVRWRDDPRTKVRLIRDVGRSLRELEQIRLYAWRGQYDEPVSTSACSPLRTHTTTPIT